MSTPPLAPPSSASFLEVLYGFDNDVDADSLVTAGSVTLVPETAQEDGNHNRVHFDDYAEFSAAGYPYFDLNYAHNSSSPVQASNPCSSFDKFPYNEYGVSNMSTTPDLDTFPTLSCGWKDPSQIINGSETILHHRLDSRSSASPVVDSFIPRNNRPSDAPIWDSGTDTRHEQFCERLMGMMNEESINPRLVLNFMRRKTAAGAGLPSRRHRAVHRDARTKLPLIYHGLSSTRLSQD
ncbi:hypothetical protein R3P38DRAFT_3266924 [Favolaschia claudopus]|uniref:Uncharacterized protein n=1 Tax=Favolaschia claudopus TaxID=2862362 RepID=A0AAW0BTP5_9AGAR